MSITLYFTIIGSVSLWNQQLFIWSYVWKSSWNLSLYSLFPLGRHEKASKVLSWSSTCLHEWSIWQNWGIQRGHWRVSSAAYPEWGYFQQQRCRRISTKGMIKISYKISLSQRRIQMNAHLQIGFYKKFITESVSCCMWRSAKQCCHDNIKASKSSNDVGVARFLCCLEKNWSLM